MIYPETTNRNDPEAIQPILERIVKEIAAKQKELQQTKQNADDIDGQAAAARDAGDYQKAFKLTQEAIQLHNKAKTIKEEIAELDNKHALWLYRARSNNIEYR